VFAIPRVSCFLSVSWGIISFLQLNFKNFPILLPLTAFFCYNISVVTCNCITKET